MNLCKIALRPTGPFVSPWQSDTLFGHLCWVKMRRDGADALGEMLEACRQGRPPFVLSSGFPGDLLPRPLACRAPDRASPEETFEAGRALKDTRFLPLDSFESARRGEPVEGHVADPFVQTESLHASISRRRAATGAEGTLFAVQDTWLADETGVLSVYAVVQTGREDELRELFGQLAESGFGKKQSTGKGSFELAGFDRFTFKEVPDADGFVTLSNLVPAAKDPTDGLYRTFVKFGKLGQERSFGGRPFKKPLVMLEPGACFRTTDVPEWFCGRMVDGLSPAYPDATQCGLALALPFRWPKSNTRG